MDQNKFPAVQRNSASVKGDARILPKPIVIQVRINGHPARALIDTGSLGDLETPLGLQLAVQGSRSRHFDIINLNSYDIILGTPWLYQHRICVGLNPARLIIGQDNPAPIQHGQDTKLMVHNISLRDQELAAVRAELQALAEPLCRDVEETDLPPFRDINHHIPLIDDKKIYPYAADTKAQNVTAFVAHCC